MVIRIRLAIINKERIFHKANRDCHITGRKEAIMILHKLNHKFWANEVKQNSQVPINLKIESATHVTLDNNDGNQETATGRGTSRNTIMTVSQPVLKGESLDDQDVNCVKEDYLDLCDRLAVPEYELGKQHPPPIFPDHRETGKEPITA
eukprot:gene19617-21553_t